ncbi:GNAT family N-acetyltransferase [Celeribacter marinus]|uniref:Histone acetyltransferase HPA2 and related acetyltransferase n=1 Tax=Celeribacter marinus TaxID=1397108 RepID=A0A0N9ZHG5_9RHOB|nr:GNAT family N-acetyltransferase [Celeribacter marinus]ALI55201.1 histone acetyltransferase HPA2 and related acetyltransferase [Celeribacter marinus]SFK09295.1 Ribosomal protein S18 acetylase RimI [Celeribacter marinus]
MLIRDAVQSDLPAVAAIHVASWRMAYRELLSDDYLGQPVADDLNGKWVGMDIPAEDILLVATDDNAVTGFIYVKGGKQPAYINNLHVDPTRKRAGIGAALMKAAAQTLIARGHNSAYLTVITDNAAAVDFYRKLGGAFGPKQDELLYGEPVQTYPVHWDDLRELAD